MSYSLLLYKCTTISTTRFPTPVQRSYLPLACQLQFLTDVSQKKKPTLMVLAQAFVSLVESLKQMPIGDFRFRRTNCQEQLVERCGETTF